MRSLIQQPEDVIVQPINLITGVVNILSFFHTKNLEVKKVAGAYAEAPIFARNKAHHQWPATRYFMFLNYPNYLKYGDLQPKRFAN